MNAFGYYQLVFKQYAQFSGRSRRSEYWWFVLFNLIITYGLMFLGLYVLHITWLGSLYSLAALIPSIAVGVRRMHDVDKSGWFLLIPIYNLILAATPGTVGPNEYGPDPKGAAEVFNPNPEVY